MTEDNFVERNKQRSFWEEQKIIFTAHVFWEYGIVSPKKMLFYLKHSEPGTKKMEFKEWPLMGVVN